MRCAEKWNEHTRRLPSLVVGNYVRFQNQTGPYPTKWDKTGRVVEVRQFHQYVVRVDGSVPIMISFVSLKPGYSHIFTIMLSRFVVTTSFVGTG